MKLTRHTPVVAPKLTVEQLDLLMAHLLRLRLLFQKAQSVLKPSHFNSATEPHYHALWGVILELVKKHGEEAILGDPQRARTYIEAELDALTRSAPEVYSPAVMELLFAQHIDRPALVPWIVEECAQEQLQLSYGLDLLRKFLYERTVNDDFRQLFRNANDLTVQNLPEVCRDVLQAASKIDRIGSSSARSFAEDFADFEKRLGFYRGRTLIGLKTGMERLDEHTLGLRGLTVLGAGPGIGKTSYALQCGISVCQHNADAVLVVFSLEMDHFALQTRVLCYLAGLDWKTIMLGSESLRGKDNGPWFTTQEQQKLDAAMQQLRAGPLGQRILILDRKALGDDLTALELIGHVNQFKEQCGASRALVVLDYLQRLPVPPAIARQGDLEADRYRVQTVQDLLAASQTESNPVGDALMVISEARKPSGGSHSWGNSLADLMGSARIAYAADAVLTFQPMRDTDEVAQYGWPTFSQNLHDLESMQQAGISPVRLELVKGRDGMMRGGWGLAFHFQESRFTEAMLHATPQSSSAALFNESEYPDAPADTLPDLYAGVDTGLFTQ